ncbi:unnamed protein product [Protopolystoma xenopodis]|uniref:Uncharacterized protein n=1 Tax=Protopolystoma xenopodis TaxID=117903 RepID=A0A448XJ70_9PLAT|nr:unnamed protein product [Protopolystoma xenopodis]
MRIRCAEETVRSERLEAEREAVEVKLQLLTKEYDLVSQQVGSTQERVQGLQM